MGSRLEYYILFRSKFKQRINVGKGIKNRKKSLKERFLLGNFVFRCLSSFGIIDYLYERLSLDMNMGYRIAFGILLIVYSFIRGIRIINDNKD
jgi:hydrogenase-4 membrane subunit HyfE